MAKSSYIDFFDMYEAEKTVVNFSICLIMAENSQVAMHVLRCFPIFSY